ncbi:MAG: FtsW/RodA/SpoVE family cell cycle protein [Lachnospiraceae bacterium]|nr:FtsW/RodA/SpoVE family cell cycle protein [Lachnospiraceae bacterium]
MYRLYKQILTKIKTYQFNHLNLRLIIFLISISVLGLNVIASATDETTYETKQLMGLIMGLIAMTVIALIDYHFVLKFAWLIYAFNLVLLLAVKIFGEEHLGAQRWIEIAGIQIQPSEFAKIFMILFFAYFFNKYKDRLNTFKILFATLVLFGIPILLIYKQPDLSTSIAICVVFAVMIYMAGLSYKVIFSFIGVMIPVMVVLVYLIMQPDQTILEPYQYNRLVGFYDEDNEAAQAIGYQQRNAVLAIGSGGLWGKGLNNTSEDSIKNGNYIPEPQTDFIFAIVGEELGFVGTASLIVLLALICFECVYIGAHAPDMAGKIICSGVAAIIAIQTFINIAVVTNMMPNTGLTLPFVSYGLSSLLSLYIGMGFVLNVGLQRRKLV